MAAVRFTKTKILNDGSSVPVLGFGTATAPNNPQKCSEHIVLAIQKGFTHIDTAHVYNNESSVGTALKKWGGKREDVYISSKWGHADPDHDHDPEAELRQSLAECGVEYLDLWLLHIPNAMGWNNAAAWRKMEEIQKKGLVRSIGVSNFPGQALEELSKTWTVKPSVNQIEYHPYCFFDPRMVEMEEVCKKFDIAISPYAAIGPLNLFPGGPVDEVVMDIGKAKGVSAAQVLLAWSFQRTNGGPVITTASAADEWHYDQILDSTDIKLTHEEMEKIEAAGRAGGPKGAKVLPAWDIGVSILG